MRDGASPSLVMTSFVQNGPMEVLNSRRTSVGTLLHELVYYAHGIVSILSQCQPQQASLMATESSLQQQAPASTRTAWQLYIISATCASPLLASLVQDTEGGF